MKIKDKDLKKEVDVSRRDCPLFECYWPRPDPGMFVQGRGYQSRGKADRGYICGTREIHGCPDKPKLREET
jgi:hypothetical protein